MKTDTVEILATLGVSGLSALAAVGADQETKILAFCIVGSALGGIVAISSNGHGENAPPVSVRQKRFRWFTNFAGGIFTGPFVADHALRNLIPDANPTYVALAAGGLCGFAAVAVLCLAGPFALKWIGSKLKTPSKLP